MKKMKKFILASLLSCLVLLTACGQKASPDQGAGDNKIRLGVSPVPHEEIIKALEPEFKKTGLDVEVTTFDDYVMPNLALDQGDLDANFFQHAPYLDDFIKERGVKLANLGAVHLEPIGFYSDKYKSVDELEDGDEILIPNDATNGGRALILLEKAGVIKLNDPSNLAVTEKDITENPKNLKFTAVEAATIPRAYEDAAIAVINSNFALEAKLSPKKDAIAIEKSEGNPFANIIAAREEDKDNETYKKVLEAFQSDEVRKYIEEKFDGEIIPAK